jgi:hypothetical protein
VDDASEDVLSDFRIEDLLTALEQAIARIGDPRMETVARCRILPGEFATLEELGERFGVTRENVRLIELRALGRMRNGWQSDRLLSGLARELNAGRGSFENAVLHLRAMIARVASGDAVDPVTVALIGVFGDPEILHVDIRKLATEARRVIATARKANVLEIATSGPIPPDHAKQGGHEVNTCRSEMERMLAGELNDASAPQIQEELTATQRWLARYNAALDPSPAGRRAGASFRAQDASAAHARQALRKPSTGESRNGSAETRTTENGWIDLTFL